MSVTAYHFSSPTCKPCKDIKIMVDMLKEDFSHYTWISVNVRDDSNDYATKFGVSIVPTIVVVTKDAEGNVKKHVSCNTPWPYTDRYTGTQLADWTRVLRNASKI